MTEEYLEVVDEEDRVIRSATFAEVRENGLRRRTVNAMMTTPRLERIALALRSKDQKSSPGKWHLTAGGHNNSGESYKEAAYREILEELFEGQAPRTPFNLIEVAKFRNDVPERRKFEYTTFFYAVHEGPFFPDPGEIERISWMPTDEVLSDLRGNPDKYTVTMGVVMPFFQKRRQELGYI